MKALLAAIRRRLRPGRKDTHVMLTFADGGTTTVGPMTLFTAECFLHLMGFEQQWVGRRVARARLVLP